MAVSLHVRPERLDSLNKRAFNVVFVVIYEVFIMINAVCIMISPVFIRISPAFIYKALLAALVSERASNDSLVKLY